jgi:hypothetical protein
MSDVQKLAETVAAEFESAWTGSKRKAAAALAGLVRLAEEADTLRAELRIREESQIPVLPRAAQERLEAAEADRDRLAAALQEIHHLAQTRRTGLHMDGSEHWAHPLVGEIHAIARAALRAGEDAE